MGILDRFRKKKKEEKPSEEVKKTATDLEIICGDDKETYEASHNTMFLDPRKIGTSMKEAAKKAKKFEKSGDTVRTRTWYETAGGLAIYKGDVEKVKQFFGKCQELFPKSSYKILENPKKVVKKAQEYYQKYLKEEEKK